MREYIFLLKCKTIILREMLECVIGAMCKESHSGRPWLQAVLIDLTKINDRIIKLAASDGYRLSVVERDSSDILTSMNTNSKDVRLVIGKNDVYSIYDILKNRLVKGNDHLECRLDYYTNGDVEFICNGWTYKFAKADDHPCEYYPDYDQVIPLDFDIDSKTSISIQRFYDVLKENKKLKFEYMKVGIKDKHSPLKLETIKNGHDKKELKLTHVIMPAFSRGNKPEVVDES